MFKKSKNDLFEIPQDNKVIMHIDMNSYFATCEQQANPAWRGRPLGVVSYLHPKGTIIAASREAKEIGIGTGTKVWEAKQACPDIVLVRDDPTKYRVITERIQAIFNSYTPDVENYSIDESFLEFPISNSHPFGHKQFPINDQCSIPKSQTGEKKQEKRSKKKENRIAAAQYKLRKWIPDNSNTRYARVESGHKVAPLGDDSVDEGDNKKNKEQDLYDEVEVIAIEIKKRIKEEVGDWLTCSVGVAKTKFFAKLGSDFKKPDGLTFVSDQTVDYLLGQLELTDVWGISFGLKRQLNALGIFTPLDIKYAKPSFFAQENG